MKLVMLNSRSLIKESIFLLLLIQMQPNKCKNDCCVFFSCVEVIVVNATKWCMKTSTQSWENKGQLSPIPALQNTPLRIHSKIKSQWRIFNASEHTSSLFKAILKSSIVTLYPFSKYLKVSKLKICISLHLKVLLFC